jgi:short-subunit dehydrogenase
MEFENKVIWITGASSGIGEALAIKLSAYNCKLILSARNEVNLKKVKQKCLGDQSRIKTLPLDLADAASIQGKVQEAEALFGSIDILVNNGGISQRSLALDTKLEIDRRIMEVNYFGSITLSKLVLPKMKERKSGHHVIVTSVSGVVGSPMRSAYCASKHALHGFYNALRAEMHDYNIDVTLIAPGYIKTDISFHALSGDGTPHNKLDPGQANGIDVNVCAEKIISAIKKRKAVAFIAGAKESLAVFLSRFAPALLRVLAVKVQST